MHARHRGAAAFVAGAICLGALCGGASADLEAFLRSGDTVDGEIAAGGEKETLRVACGNGDTFRAEVRTPGRRLLRVRLLDQYGGLLKEAVGRSVRIAKPVPGEADEVALEVSAADGLSRERYTARVRCGPTGARRTVHLRAPAVPAGASFIEVATIGRRGGSVAPSRFDAVAGTTAGFVGNSVAQRTTVLVGAAADIDPGVGGLTVAGPAVTYGPPSMRIAPKAPVTVTLPYVPGAVTQAVRVFRAATAGGAATEITSVTVDAGNAVVRFSATRLGTFQAFDGPAPGGTTPGTPVIPTDPRAYDRLGAVAVDGPGGGDTFVAGSELHREDIGGTFTEVGAAYVFERNTGGTWTPAARLLDPSLTPGSKFGHAVAIDGDVIAVGAPAAIAELGHLSASQAAGAVHVFERTGDTWAETAVIPSPHASFTKGFGASVALQGGRLVIGAPLHRESIELSGAAFVYERGPGGWTQTAELESGVYSSYAAFGFRVGLDGDAILASDPYDGGGFNVFGAVYAFRLVDGAWLLEQKLVAPARSALEMFGADLALQGDRALIGGPGRVSATGKRTGAAYVFERAGGTWSMAARIDGPATGAADEFATSVALDGDAALIGAPSSSFAAPKGGAAFLVRRGSGAWTSRSTLVPAALAAHDAFGSFVALNGNDAFVVAPDADGASPNTGAVHVLDVSAK